MVGVFFFGVLILLAVLLCAGWVFAAAQRMGDRRESKVLREARQVDQFENEAMVCPHCQTRGGVSTWRASYDRELQGWKIGVAVWAAVLMGYVVYAIVSRSRINEPGSMLFLSSLPAIAFGAMLVGIDLFYREPCTRARCEKCSNSWRF